MVGNYFSIYLQLLQECLFFLDSMKIKEGFGAGILVPEPFCRQVVAVMLD
jgi:hypothetical protein